MNHKADIVLYIYLLNTKLTTNQREYLIQPNMMFERNNCLKKSYMCRTYG